MLTATVYRQYLSLTEYGDPVYGEPAEVRRIQLDGDVDHESEVWRLALAELHAAITEDRTRPVQTYVTLDRDGLPGPDGIPWEGYGPGTRTTPCVYGAHIIEGLSMLDETVDGVPVRTSRIDGDWDPSRYIRVEDTVYRQVRLVDEAAWKYLPPRPALSTTMELVDIDANEIRHWKVRARLLGAYPTADDIRAAARQMLAAVPESDRRLVDLDVWLVPVEMERSIHG
jgi:hypothetical protein